MYMVARTGPQVKTFAEALNVSEALVNMYLPYEKTVYDLKEKSGNAKRIERWKEEHHGH